MGHSYARNYVHCIFSTKGRRPLIPQERRPALFAYFRGIATGEGFELIEAGGAADHVHLLFVLPPARTLSEAVQKFKGASSRWMGPEFSWQEGYGAFSVSPSRLPEVRQYLRNQEVHHRKRDFEAEFLALLRSCGVPYDAQYVLG